MTSQTCSATVFVVNPEEKLREARTRDGVLDKLLDSLESEGDVILVGGALRSWYYGQEPRDLDFCVDASPSAVDRICKDAPERTSFGGYRFGSIDIFPFSTVWCFEKYKIDATLDNLFEYMFLNVDAIAYSLKSGVLKERGFFDGVSSKTLKMNHSYTPIPLSNALKVLSLANRHHLLVDEELQMFVRTSTVYMSWDCVRKLYEKRYGHSISKPYFWSWT